MRSGQNPAKAIKEVAKPQRITVAVFKLHSLRQRLFQQYA